MKGHYKSVNALLIFGSKEKQIIGHEFQFIMDGQAFKQL